MIEEKYYKIHKKMWTLKEDEFLISQREKSQTWKEISDQIQNSNPRTCKRRYERLLKFS